MIFTLVLIGIFAAAVALPVLGITLWLRHRRWSASREGRRHPLKAPLLRPAGHTTGLKAEEMLGDFLTCFWLAIFLPIMVALVHFARISYTGATESLGSIGFSILLALLLMAGTLWEARRVLERRRSYRLGWEGELASAEGLAPLQGMGYRIFHDLPGDKFNIDHVLIGPNGVFAIETKVRIKHGLDKETHRVSYDGKTLKFPNGMTDGPILQARRQAAWLGKWLSRATQIPLSPAAVVAIPGWWIDQTGRGDVYVISPVGGAKFLPKIKTDMVLSAQQIDAIAYQIEQKCRDVVLSEALI